MPPLRRTSCRLEEKANSLFVPLCPMLHATQDDMLPQKLTLTLWFSARAWSLREPLAELPSQEILAFGPDEQRFRPRTYRAKASSLF